MSIQSEITRINNLKGKIKTSLISWGIVNSAAKLDDCATAIENTDVHNDISVEIQEGNTYQIPRGYHVGNGTISAVGGGGNYTLQSKTATPSTTTQTITPDVGKYGLDSVTINPIPSNYKDVSSTTATASDVLKGKAFVGADGQQVTGGIENRGSLSKSIDGLTSTSVTIDAGYYSGGSVSLTSAIETALAEI